MAAVFSTGKLILHGTGIGFSWSLRLSSYHAGMLSMLYAWDLNRERAWRGVRKSC